MLLYTYVWFIYIGYYYFLFFYFSVRLLSVLRGHSFFSSPPQRPMTSDFEGFLYQILSITLFVYLNSWERAPVFPFSMLSAKQGNYWYDFITSLEWRGPWLGIEPGTSRTRCQHSTTRLSKRVGGLIEHWNLLDPLV